MAEIKMFDFKTQVKNPLTKNKQEFPISDSFGNASGDATFDFILKRLSGNHGSIIGCHSRRRVP